MSVQRYVTTGGAVRYRARVKSHGRYVATRVFDRKADAVAWEQEQSRRLRVGEWIDPRRGRVPLSVVAEDWLQTRQSVKRRTREADTADWRLHIEPQFGRHPVGSITSAEIATWLGGLVGAGKSPASASRYLATLRSILNYAVADARITVNPAGTVRRPRSANGSREGHFLTVPQLRELADTCTGRYAELVLVLGLQGLRWGEMAGLRVGDRIDVPGPGLRLQRAVLSSGEGGGLFVDTLKNHRARTVPLVDDVIPIIDRWARDKARDEWLFDTAAGTALDEQNWKRSVAWNVGIKTIGMPRLRVHDLRHTAASVWLGAGADPKVVQRILGHSSAAMTMDLYGHLIDQNLWDAVKRLRDNGDTSGTSQADESRLEGDSDDETSP